MYPKLFSIGPVNIQTAGVLSVLAFLLTGYIVWKKSREEHYDEVEVFDGYILSTIFSFILARAVYIALNFFQFGWDVLKWLDFVNQPGIQPIVFLWGVAIFLFRFARNKKWDEFEVLDFWSIAVVLGLIFKNIGEFFKGSSFGLPTTLPWGLVFPGMIQKSHPIQLYWIVFYLAIYLYLSWAEYHFRTFEWYRAGKKTARSGFVLANFLLLYSIFSIAISFIKLPEIMIFNFPADIYIYTLGFIFGLLLLWKRARR